VTLAIVLRVLNHVAPWDMQTQHEYYLLLEHDAPDCGFHYLP
jgi:hypothetical protein